LRTRVVAWVTIVLLVLIAVEARFALWTTQILSESLGISLGILAIAAWWRVSTAPTKRRVTWAWVFTIAWLLERDAQTLPVALVVVPIAAAAWYWGRSLTQEVRHQLISGALVALVACGYVYVAQSHSGRNRYSVEDNIGLRVLPDPSLRRWFVEGGMPMNAAVEGRTGKSAFDDNRAFDTDPALASLHNWVEGPGSRRMLESFLLRSPDYYRMLSKQWNSILSDNLTAYDGYGVEHRLPQRYPLETGGPGTSHGLSLWLFLVVVTLGFATALSRRRGPLIFAAGGLVAVLVDLYLTFAGDALEVSRHLVGPLDRLSVFLVLSIAISVDLVWQARRPTSGDAAPPQPESDQLTFGIAQGD
jgi:hypothetical protein